MKKIETFDQKKEIVCSVNLNRKHCICCLAVLLFAEQLLEVPTSDRNNELRFFRLILQTNLKRTSPVLHIKTIHYGDDKLIFLQSIVGNWDKTLCGSHIAVLRMV
jgi:hypothetical protein